MAKYLWIAVPLGLLALMSWCLYSHLRRVAEALHMKRPRLVAAVGCVLLLLPICRLWAAFYWVVLLLHFCVFAVVADGADAVIRRVCRKGGHVWRALHTFLVPPLLCTAAVALYGYANIHDVRETEYTVATAKDIRPEGYRFALLADVHYGLLDNRDAVQRMADSLSGRHLDFVVIAGDLVDEGSTLEDVQEICRILGGIKTAYGVYCVYGNHDPARYSAHSDFTLADLEAALKANGICVLADDVVALNGEILLAGRLDRTMERASVEDLLKGADPARYLIVADHQPHEFEEKAAAGVDLQLSGHTHSGQVFPVGHLCSLFHIGDLNYGHARFGGMEAIVTSGFTGWGGPIRTQNHSEYVIVELRRK